MYLGVFPSQIGASLCCKVFGNQEAEPVCAVFCVAHLFVPLATRCQVNIHTHQTLGRSLCDAKCLTGGDGALWSSLQHGGVKIISQLVPTPLLPLLLVTPCCEINAEWRKYNMA